MTEFPTTHLVRDRTLETIGIPEGWDIYQWVAHLITKGTEELTTITDKTLKTRTTLNERSGILSTLHANMKIADYISEVEMPRVDDEVKLHEIDTKLTEFKILLNAKATLLKRYKFRGVDTIS